MTGSTPRKLEDSVTFGTIRDQNLTIEESIEFLANDISQIDATLLGSSLGNKKIIMSYDVGAIQGDGQSLMNPGVGGGGALVPVADGDTWAWPYRQLNPAQGSEAPYSSVDPTVNGGTNGNAALSAGTCAVHGAVAMLRQLYEKEGISRAEQPRLYATQNAQGGTPLSLHTNHQESFETGLSQSLAARTYARNHAQRGRFLMKLIACTEADSVGNTPPLAYYNLMLDDIAKAQDSRYRSVATEQQFGPMIVTSQAASIRGNQRWAIARTLYQLALEHPEFIVFSGPISDLPYTYDNGGYPKQNTGGLHPSQLGCYLHGARMGLAGYRRLRGLNVKPIHCVARHDDGTTLFLTFALRYGVKLSRSKFGGITLQPNCGIACVDTTDGNAPVAFTATPSICRDFVTLAFPLGMIPKAGLRIDFGQPALKMYPYSPGTYNIAPDTTGYISAVCDLHDNNDLVFKNEALHIEYPMYDPFPIHSIMLTNSGAGFEVSNPTTGG